MFALQPLVRGDGRHPRSLRSLPSPRIVIAHLHTYGGTCPISPLSFVHQTFHPLTTSRSRVAAPRYSGGLFCAVTACSTNLLLGTQGLEHKTQAYLYPSYGCLVTACGHSLDVDALAKFLCRPRQSSEDLGAAKGSAKWRLQCWAFQRTPEADRYISWRNNCRRERRSSLTRWPEVVSC